MWKGTGEGMMSERTETGPPKTCSPKATAPAKKKKVNSEFSELSKLMPFLPIIQGVFIQEERAEAQ